MITQDSIMYFVFQEKTVFMPFRYLDPECLFLIKEHEGLYPLNCMRGDCFMNRNCAESLAKRVWYFFENVEPSAKLMIAYFKYRDKPNSIRAGIFSKDMSEPRVSTLNPYAFRKFQKEGVTKRWWPSLDFCGIGKEDFPKLISLSDITK